MFILAQKEKQLPSNYSTSVLESQDGGCSVFRIYLCKMRAKCLYFRTSKISKINVDTNIAYAKIKLGSGQSNVERGQNERVESVELFWLSHLEINLCKKPMKMGFLFVYVIMMV